MMKKKKKKKMPNSATALLLDAARHGDLSALKEGLAQPNIDIDAACCRVGWTALHNACFAGNSACVKELLKHRPSLEQRSNREGIGDTALELVVWNAVGDNAGSIRNDKKEFEPCARMLRAAGAALTWKAEQCLKKPISPRHKQCYAKQRIALRRILCPEARPSAPESTLGGTLTCSVCFEGEKDHLAYKCGHQCACAGCAKKLKKCPICREPVVQWVKVRIA